MKSWEARYDEITRLLETLPADHPDRRALEDEQCDLASDIGDAEAEEKHWDALERHMEDPNAYLEDDSPFE